MRYISLFSGIEAASVAWHPLGWTPVAFAEFEPFPSAVLKERFPDVPNLGDVTKFKEWPDVCLCPTGKSDWSGGEERSAGSGVEQATELHSELNGQTRGGYCGKCGGFDGTVDLIVGGSPCQSFSVAGLRKGLDDPRGNLALTYLAIVEKYQPKWFVWENVPGVLSSNGGRDFGSFLGAVEKLGYGFAYRVLDAQYVRTPGFPHAVPQRRRRVFVVGCLGDAGRAAAVLFDGESLSGNPPPRREKRKGVATDAQAGARGDGESVTISEHSVCGTLSDGAHMGGSLNGQDAYTGRVMAVSKNISPVLEPIVLDRASFNQGENAQYDPYIEESELMSSLVSKGPHAVAYENHPQDSRIKETEVGQSLSSAGGFATSTLPLVQTIAYENHPTDSRIKELDEVGPTVAARWGTGGGNQPLVQADVKQVQWSSGGGQTENDTAQSLRSNAEYNYQFLRNAMQVRRLTPVECERLQGFPDDWTRIPWRKKEAQDCPDGPRYKAIGNSMAVNVMQWIGMRIAMVEEITDEIS